MALDTYKMFSYGIIVTSKGPLWLQASNPFMRKRSHDSFRSSQRFIYKKYHREQPSNQWMEDDTDEMMLNAAQMLACGFWGANEGLLAQPNTYVKNLGGGRLKRRWFWEYTDSDGSSLPCLN